MGDKHEIKRSAIDDSVKEIVTYYVYLIIRESMKRSIKNFREKFSEKSIGELEKKLKDASKNEIEKYCDDVINETLKEIQTKEIGAKGFLKDIESIFEKNLTQKFSTLIAPPPPPPPATPTPTPTPAAPLAKKTALAFIKGSILFTGLIAAGAMGLFLTDHPPIAYIDSISPNPADQGDIVTFNGHGTDSDPIEFIIAYEWKFGGKTLSNSQSFSTSNLPPGTYTIYFRVRDNRGKWSDAAKTILTITPQNNPPNAYIDSINPSPANPGDEVRFRGHGSDPDGDQIVAYEWRSSIDGKLSSSREFSKTGLSPGTHTIFFKVKDNKGSWSPEAQETIMVNIIGNNPPNAYIDSINPSPANPGDEVRFRGRGSDPDGDKIVAYEWISSIDKKLSISPEFSKTGLTPGTHTIYFKVKDSRGAWSNEAQRILRINNPPIAYIDSINPSPATQGDKIYFNGHGSDPDGDSIVAYEWRSSIDGKLSSSSTFSTSKLSPGTHTIFFKVKDNKGAWSSEAQGNILIQKNNPPIAYINYIQPGSVFQGLTVCFSGRGEDPDRDKIVAYEWRSSIDGKLSSSSTFCKSNLSPGTHTIYFKVQDSRGAWSTEAKGTVEIKVYMLKPIKAPS